MYVYKYNILYNIIIDFGHEMATTYFFRVTWSPEVCGVLGER